MFEADKEKFNRREIMGNQNIRWNYEDISPELMKRIENSPIQPVKPLIQGQERAKKPIIIDKGRQSYQPVKKSKYNAVKTVVNGITFSSKLEAHLYQELLLEVENELILRQIPFFLADKVKYITDFVVFKKGWEKYVRFIEVKGFETAVWKLKSKLMKDKFPQVTIEVIKK
jgi:hypothetical protein